MRRPHPTSAVVSARGPGCRRYRCCAGRSPARAPRAPGWPGTDERYPAKRSPSLVLEFDPLVGTLEIDVPRRAQPVRVVPHAAEHRQLDDLLLAEVLLHGGKRRVVVARFHLRHHVGPAYGGLLARVEVRALHVVVALSRGDLLVGEADLLAERHVVRHAIAASVARGSLDADELLGLHLSLIALHLATPPP